MSSRHLWCKPYLFAFSVVPNLIQLSLSSSLVGRGTVSIATSLLHYCYWIPSRFSRVERLLIQPVMHFKIDFVNEILHVEKTAMLRSTFSEVFGELCFPSLSLSLASTHTHTHTHFPIIVIVVIIRSSEVGHIIALFILLSPFSLPLVAKLPTKKISSFHPFAFTSLVFT